MVDWKKLKHAQGPATRVPALIKDLDKPGHAGEAAALQLLEALVVEGRWLPTSAPAAELLVERLTHKGAEPNPMALRLLADLGAGDHLCFVRPDAPARRSKDKQAQATLAIARRVVPLVQSWLTVRDAATRAAAVFFLALCDEEAAAAKAIASVARSDAAPAVRAGAAIALGLYARAGHAPSATVLAALEGDDHVAAGRWAGRVIAGMKFSPEEAAAGVAAWFTRWEPGLLPWGRGLPLRMVRALASALPDGESLAPVLVRTAAALGGVSQESGLLCRLAVDLAGFTRDFKQGEVVPAQALSPLQRATAEALIATPDALLSLEHGLPGSSRAAARWLGLAPPGPLERGDRWQKVRALLAKKKPNAAAVLAESLKGLGAADQLEVAGELLLGAYRILIDCGAKIPPEAIAELARAAGKDAVPWAKRLLNLAAETFAAGRTTFMLSPSHLTTVLGVVVGAGGPIEPTWSALVALDSSPASRKVLAAMPAGARDALVLARLDAVDSLHDDDKADLLEQLVELLDGIGSKKVVARLLAILGSGEVEDIVAPDVAKRLRSAAKG